MVLQRWAELSNRRSSYPLYELIDKPTGIAVYRDPLASLKQTLSVFSDFPELAVKVKRLWLYGFYTAETNRLIADLLRNCKRLASLSLPWTTIRYLDSETWQTVIAGRGRALESLEFQCVEPMLQHVLERGNDISFDPLPSVDLSHLRRLKIFGATTFMPITDNDLLVVARTATSLEEFHVTCTSHVTSKGVMAVAKASRDTLRILEYSPQSQQDYQHAPSGSSGHPEHLCDTLRSCARLQTLSISLPAACADLFTREDVRFGGGMQVRARHICGYEGSVTTPSSAKGLQALLQAARGLDRWNAGGCAPRDLYIEMLFAECIFEPVLGLVHGDFTLAQASSSRLWPTGIRPSSKGPYGRIGADDKDEAKPFQCIDEDEFLMGVHQGLYSITL